MSNETLTELKPLILTGDGYSCTVAPDAETKKAQLLKHSALIVEVKDNASANAAQLQVKELAAMRNLVEKMRVTIKAPVLAIGKTIDQKAADFVATLEAEEKRLKKLVQDFAVIVEQERQKVLRELEAKRQEEARQERLRQQALAEAERLKQAAIDALLDAQSPEQEQEAVEAKEAAREAVAAIPEPVVTQSAPVMVPQEVSKVKFVTDFEVTDIDKLYRYDVSLVTMTPRRMEILNEIQRLTVGETLPTIPGLNIVKRASVSTR